MSSLFIVLALIGGLIIWTGVGTLLYMMKAVQRSKPTPVEHLMIGPAYLFLFVATIIRKWR